MAARNKVRLCLLCVVLFGNMALASLFTEIEYSIIDLGGDRWEYTYDVTNISLIPPIEEFTIYFDYGLYDNLVVTTPETPPEWGQIVWQVEPVLNDPGGYDALANAGNLAINPGETLSGFSVSFDWLGTGDPGSQFYEIIDPVSFNTMDSGYTVPVPEPATICLFAFGSLALLRKRITR